jgi:leucyl-tRNA synthetase
VIQVDGKTRDRIEVPSGTDREHALEQAIGRESVHRHLMGTKPKNVIFIPDRLINLVTQLK